MKGKFIVIEGIDGCGKTTQIDEISRWLPTSGLMGGDSKLIKTRDKKIILSLKNKMLRIKNIIKSTSRSLVVHACVRVCITAKSG